MSAAFIIEQVARLLNDAEPGFEEIRWTKRDLLDYFNGAQEQIYTLRKDLFSETESFLLQPGSLQGPLPYGCSLQKVIGSGDGRARKIDDGLLQAFAGTGCKPVCGGVGNDYRVSGYSFNPDDPRHFFVDPPVPDDGQAHAVDITCLQEPAPLTQANVDGADGGKLAGPAWTENAIIEWMLYRAYSGDVESPQSTARMNFHLANFTTFLATERAEDLEVAQNQAGPRAAVSSDPS